MIKKIIQDIKSGKLTRDIDEKYAGGFWDLAIEMLAEASIDMENDIYYTLLENIYNTCWEIYEQ